MACDIAALQSLACANGYSGASDRKLWESLLVALCNATGGGGGTGDAVPLAAGVSSGTVVFTTPLAAAPSAVVVSVQDSSGNQVIAASPVAITAVGFTFNLSGVTESANLSLHYVVIA